MSVDTATTEILRNEILLSLEKIGYRIVDGELILPKSEKEFLRKIQLRAREEFLVKNFNFLIKNLPLAYRFSPKIENFSPEEIELELRFPERGSVEETLFRWWNLVWWSMPYQRPYGRQIRGILWDKKHDAFFGLFLLQSPIFRLKVRDEYLNLPRDTHDYWINLSLQAHRIGAVPPYNELLGGKMVALSVTCNELREHYREKYSSATTLIKGRKIEPELFFITTTSAFGRSSLYNRLKFKDQKVAFRVGFSSGFGTFHIPDDVYYKMIEFLKVNGVDTRRGYGYGPSQKLRLVSKAFRMLGLKNFTRHQIKREVYLFPLVENLDGVIHRGEEPRYFDRPFDELQNWWKERWCIPRSKRILKWKEYDRDAFFEAVEKELRKLVSRKDFCLVEKSSYSGMLPMAALS